MANAIIPKKSSVSGKAPTASQLATGELALNLKDGTLYFKDDVGVVKTLAMAGLLDSGVTAGTYGSTTIVPRFTVDAKGRVTAVTNQTIAFPVTSVFGRTGAVTLGSSDVTTALGFSPANASGANASGTWNNAADHLLSADTRGVNEAPADFTLGAHFDFKSNTTNGLADGGTYNGVLTLRKWGTGTDNSGGSVNQLGFTENGNLWIRSGAPGGSWAAWKRVITSDGTGAAGNWNIRTLGQTPVATAPTTSNLYTGQYTLVARVTISAQYNDVNVGLLAKSRGSGSADCTDIINFRVKQQAAFGSDPMVELNAVSLSSQRLAQYGYAIVQNTPTTIVELYIKNNMSYNVVDLFESGRQLGGGTIDYFTTSAYQTAVTNIVLVDSKVNINASNLLSTLLTVDGSGSGLDADLLDGLDSTFLRNAANLNAGTLPAARLAGTYNNISVKLDADNVVFSPPNTGSVATNAAAISHLASYRSSSATQVGAIAFIAPASLAQAMLQLNVRGLIYNQHIIDFIAQGYWNGTGWYDMRKLNYGSLDLQVRWGRTNDTGQICLIIGDYNTSWVYPHFDIVQALVSHGSWTDASLSGWKVATITDFSNITLTSPLPTGAQDTSVPRLATARTITVGSTGKTFDGTANIGFSLAEIGAPSLTGAGASGTWGINITGSAPWAGITGKPTTLGGFGITDGVKIPGGSNQDVSSINLNTLTTTGFYKGNSLLNAPDSGWWYVEVQSHDNTGGAVGWNIQILTAYGTGGNNNAPYGTKYVRYQLGTTTWTAWELQASNAPLGVGQTWQQLASLRGTGTNFTNNTKSTIQCAVTMQVSAATTPTITATVSGVVVGSATCVAVASASATVNFTVPPGATYSVAVVGSSWSITSWAELRD